jgi:uncharacterized protein YoxC
MIDLTTTNVLLGIMAAVSLIEGALIVYAAITAKRASRQFKELTRELTEQVRQLEQRHVAPLALRAETLFDEAGGVLETVKRIAERVEHSTSRVDAVVEGTVQKAGVAVDRVQGGVRKTADTVVGVVRGMRTAIEAFLTDVEPDGRRSPPQ